MKRRTYVCKMWMRCANVGVIWYMHQFFLHICLNFSINCGGRVVSAMRCKKKIKTKHEKRNSKTNYKRRTFVIQAVIMLCFTYHFSLYFRWIFFLLLFCFSMCVINTWRCWRRRRTRRNRITHHLIEKK